MNLYYLSRRIAFMSLFVFGLMSSVQLNATNCKADAGTLGTAQICTNGKTIISAISNGDAKVPDGFIQLYVLTSGDDLTIIGLSPEPVFEVDPQGSYTIHSLVFNPMTLDLGIVTPGQTTGFDVNALLRQGGGNICASLDVPGAKFNFDVCITPCAAFAGTLKTKAVECLENEPVMLEAEVNALPLVPNGFELIYVLTKGDELVIQEAGAEPKFTVDEEGIFTIHTLVYDPSTLDLGIIDFGMTTGFDVNSLLKQGGGDICAALDVPGAKFNVKECVCEATAGTLRARSHDCIDDSGKATLRANVKTSPYVPNGFEVIYVLTKGDELVIQAVNDERKFEVDEKGTFTIHTLVYDPNTLDLGIVKFGETTGFDVNALLKQGGGDICAALDVPGAKFDVDHCPCRLTVGELKAKETCLDDGKAYLEASIRKYPTGPSNFRLAFVLTRGDELLIVDVNNRPEFKVTEKGMYTIHTLVYDPNTLDLGIVEIGKTTGFDVNALLQQGGGDICAALDVPGAKFDVDHCTSNLDCEAKAGSLKPRSINCFDGYSWVKLAANVKEKPHVPHGFRVVYVLTTGDDLKIRAASYYPIFYVRGTGKATIHTLVYDPKTLDLGIIEVGKTTGFDVNSLLIQGGGDVCAALDVEGASFNIRACSGHIQTAPSTEYESQQASEWKPIGGLDNQASNIALFNDKVDMASSQIKKVNVYPNPTAGQLNLQLPSDLSLQSLQVEILDINGKVLLQNLLPSGTTTDNINISELPAGTYNVRIIGDQKILDQVRVVKSN